jgi:hypothetical protein
MGPVFLFDMGIVILVVRSASGKVDRLLSVGKVAKEVVIKELVSIIGIEAE